MSELRKMELDKAYAEYEKYARTHRPTKSDPLRTFSGWLQQNNIQVEEA